MKKTLEIPENFICLAIYINGELHTGFIPVENIDSGYKKFILNEIDDQVNNIKKLLL